MALELAQCSRNSSQWNAHPEWWLKDDKGAYIKEHGTTHMMDFGNPAVREFFAGVYLGVLDTKLASGKPVIDYIYMDGAGCSKTQYQPGIGPARSDAICSGKLAMIAKLQAQLNARGTGQNLILNGMDTPATAAMFVPTGAAGAMFDHWTILQYLNRTNGDFLPGAVDAGFAFAQSESVSNITLQIKGWPGPIVKQKVRASCPGRFNVVWRALVQGSHLPFPSPASRPCPPLNRAPARHCLAWRFAFLRASHGVLPEQDQYPPNIPTPKGAAELQRVGGERFNSELAFFLLVAEDTMFWLYSWFWGFDDWVPGQVDSSVPAGFFPQAKCQLGAPKGKATRKVGTWTYTRQYEHASVFVDLNNRTASSVTFTGAC
jgi:hypothetical protein